MAPRLAGERSLFLTRCVPSCVSAGVGMPLRRTGPKRAQLAAAGLTRALSRRQVLAQCCAGNSSCPTLRASLAAAEPAADLCNTPPSACDAQVRSPPRP